MLRMKAKKTPKSPKPASNPTPVDTWPKKTTELFDCDGNKLGELSEIDWSQVGNR